MKGVKRAESVANSGGTTETSMSSNVEAGVTVRVVKAGNGPPAHNEDQTIEPERTTELQTSPSETPNEQDESNELHVEPDAATKTSDEYSDMPEMNKPSSKSSEVKTEIVNNEPGTPNEDTPINSSPRATPTLVGINFDHNNIKANKERKTVHCTECSKAMNVKSLAKHMREQHNLKRPGEPRKWSQSEKRNWQRKASTDDEKGKRKAEGNISPQNKADSKKDKSSP